MDALMVTTKLIAEPPETTSPLKAFMILQFVKLARTTEMCAVRNTCTAPPSTPMFGLLDPSAAQLKKLQDESATIEDADLPASTANAPPLLKEDKPVLPNATVTRLSVNVDSVTLKLVRAALLAYIAPPPPLASSGRPDDAFEVAEHWENKDFDIRTLRLNPVTSFDLSEGINTPSLKLETWGA
jgi:hypothetical protein